MANACHRKRQKMMPRICEIVRHATVAGTEKHVYLLADALKKKDFDITVCTFERGEFVNALQRRGIATYVVVSSNPIAHFMKLVLFLAKSSFNVVHCHSGGYACLAAKVAGVRSIIYTKHGIGFTAEELDHRCFLRKVRDKLVDFCVSRYVALTNHDKCIMSGVLGINPDKIQVIHNGIDPLYGTNTKALAFEGQPIIGTVARLAKQKGICYLVEAAVKIREKYPDVNILVVGSGMEENALRDLVARLDLEEHVHFLGYFESAEGIIKALDVFVLPSLWEGFPYVLLEAMMLKKPIVATDIFGINEIIQHNKSGLLIEPRNADAISSAVINLCSSKKKARRLGDCAYHTVQNRFSLDNTVSKVENLYLSFVS